jgi:hypothetical protein
MKQQCPMAVAFSSEGQAKLLYCGKWSCKICAKRNSRIWSIHAYYGITAMADKSARVHFWTLTMGSQYARPAEAYKAFPRLWDATRKAIQRYHKEFTFIAFVEGQPKRSYMPHFHVLTFQSIPSGYSTRNDPLEWIKDFGAHMGFGWSNKDEMVTSLRAAGYVTKYASKGCPEIPKGFRRVRCSRNWVKSPDKAYDPYYVRSVGERIEDYLQRVEAGTGVPIDTIAQSYQKATLNLNYERARNI